MKYRDYDNLIPKVISRTSSQELEAALLGLSKTYDFVELQYAESDVGFSVLALLKKKSKKVAREERS